MQMSVTEHLRNFYEQHGDEAWRSEVRRLALNGVRTSPKHEAYWREVTKDMEWLDWAELKAQAVSEQVSHNPDQMMAEMLRRQMPGIKTQAQYDAVVGSLDAVRLVLNGILDRDVGKEAQARKTLEMALEAARTSTELTHRIEESPEAATSPAAEQFKSSPKQFQEQEVLTKLLAELAALKSQDALTAWYASTKQERERIVTQSLRNQLLDEVRAAKLALS